MVLLLGDFAFEWKQTSSVGLESEFGISAQERINNHPALISANLGSQTMSISGRTLPYHGDKQTVLKALYALASARQSYPLTSGYGKFFGRFAVEKISETQSIFTPEGLFFAQSFTLELRRDYD